jgi:hypothetical protein
MLGLGSIQMTSRIVNILVFLFLPLMVFRHSQAMIDQEEDSNLKIEHCESLKLSFPGLGGEVLRTEVSNFCFDMTYTLVISKNCQKDCVLLSKVRADRSPLKYNSIGTPGAWICEKHGGIAKMLFIENKGARLQRHFCSSGSDLVSMSYLLLTKAKGK